MPTVHDREVALTKANALHPPSSPATTQRQGKSSSQDAVRAAGAMIR